ncbi:hypothetical protein FH972_016050 [Carpinus fangiana]|uniref:FBD domain-containing protein n=1 Tax=Carpinus fangiana TaxID=176857 RepID=A0A5N6RHY7_9ROSI|nr:hypothetical protein FH972_016050 [Carpinus fangiana]
MEGFVPLPYCLFICKTLTSLHLDMLCILKLPTTICFSSLKILKIQSVTFSNEYLTRKLFSGLPVLEELELRNCSWGNLMFMSISAPKLHSLCIFENWTADKYYGSPSDFCQVMIGGDCLKEFYYNGCLIGEYCLYESFSMEEAEVVTICEDVCEQLALRMLNLLIASKNYYVAEFGFSSISKKVLTHAEGHLSQMPMFKNLMNLIIVEMCVDFPVLVKILQNFPCLQTLNFSGGLCWALPELDNDDWTLDIVPPCFLSHLKLIKVPNYGDYEVELFAVKFLLKNAVVLEELIITVEDYYVGNLEKEVKIYKALLELPRGSPNCKIILE